MVRGPVGVADVDGADDEDDPTVGTGPKVVEGDADCGADEDDVHAARSTPAAATAPSSFTVPSPFLAGYGGNLPTSTWGRP